MACSVTFVALFVVNYLDYIQRLQEINYIEWDIKTLTSGDYTVSVEIDEKFYNDYKKEKSEKWLKKCVEFCACCDICTSYHAKNDCANDIKCKSCNGIRFSSGVQGFKAWFKNQIEKRLRMLEDLGFEEDSSKVNIALITLAYNNYDMLELLALRGQAIVQEDWKKQYSIEEKMFEVMNKHLDRLR